MGGGKGEAKGERETGGTAVRSEQEAGRREGRRAGKRGPGDNGHLKPMELHRGPLLI